MADRGISITVPYVAWDTNANAGRTGDVANHTLRMLRDGVLTALTNAPTEGSAAFLPGAYQVVLTAAEADAAIIMLGGVSSTGNVSIMPVTIQFERGLQQATSAFDDGSVGFAMSRVGSGQIVTTSPVGQAGDVEIVRGDDYSAAGAGALNWTDASAGWPDLTGATVEFTAGLFSKAMSVVTPTGPGKVRLELTDTDTALFVQGSKRFTVRATLAGGDIVALVQGNLVVKAD